MNKDLEALLMVQSQDIDMQVLEARAAELAERERVLDEERLAEVAATERSRQALERESARHGGLQEKVSTHRELQQRNMAQLDQVRRMREATAAQAQVEMARQILDEEERELDHLNGRLRDLRASVTAHEEAVQALDERQKEPRAQLAAERATLASEFDAARAKRQAKAA
ncbi:MAG: zinc ribbon domain-containing protein, partial [Gemmatimonadaceae bacterium]